jgi:catechol 2,3-dioxygenase
MSIAAAPTDDIPRPIYRPPFNTTRASHVVLTVRDLSASRDFYTNVVGLAVSDEDASVVYLRGMEEACHHSLVLKATPEKPSVERIGMRVLTEEDLDALHAFFTQQGLGAKFAEEPFQGRTVRVADAVGTPVEFCASMETRPRLLFEFDRYAGGGALRLDHYQIHTPEVMKACRFYMSFGFRLSEYLVGRDGAVSGVFLQRKGNPHDIVFFDGPGPRLHHFAYTCGETRNLLHACDVAGQLGFGENIERGPGRHGPAFALYVYMRDPDGHRVELFTAHYQTIDIDDEPVRWDMGGERFKKIWGLPPPRKWIEEASPFRDVPVKEPAVRHEPITLEKYLKA